MFANSTADTSHARISNDEFTMKYANIQSANFICFEILTHIFLGGARLSEINLEIKLVKLRHDNKILIYRSKH